jgi:hypothetical protein
LCDCHIVIYNIKLTFEEISEVSSNRFKNIVKQKTEEAGFNHLLKEKNKQEKIVDIEYKKLEIQEYLKDGNRNTRRSKIIFKVQGQGEEFRDQNAQKNGGIVMLSVWAVGKKNSLKRNFCYVMDFRETRKNLLKTSNTAG